MVNSIVVDADYRSSREVPRIGQRKRMRINGRFQSMILNELKVRRMHAWDEDTGTKRIFWYDAHEVWSGYYNSEGP